MEPGVSPSQLADLCGRYSRAVDAVTVLGRTLWELAFPCQEGESEAGPGSRSDRVLLEERELLARLSRALGEKGLVEPRLPSFLMSRLRELELCVDKGEGRLGFLLSAFQPMTLGRQLLKALRPDHELRYFTLASMRRHFAFYLSAEAPHQFHSLAAAMNALIGSPPGYAQPQVLDYLKKLLPPLRCCLESPPHRTEDPAILSLFLECCRAVNYLAAGRVRGQVVLHAARVDAEYLLSTLFGMPTGIPGLDELFGGGGIMLVDELVPAGEQRISGRVVLTVGEFGTGKSLLTLQMAMEVARKGGLAWVIPLEQSVEECLYALESVRASFYDGSVVVARDPISAMRILRAREEDRGALVFLDAVKDSFDDFRVTFLENVKLMQGYSLRLILVDPVNAILEKRASSLTEQRAQTVAMFEEAKRLGANVWLVAEEHGFAEAGFYQKNIADTVIHLSRDRQHGYSQRYFEITKSRLQREQRGRHPFSIEAGSGIRIFPSPAAVNARIRPRRVPVPGTQVPFGLPSLDAILGRHGLNSGDVIVLQGPGGCLKTPLGLHFLLARGNWRDAGHGPVASLLVAARDSEATVRELLGQGFLRGHRKAGDEATGLRICSLHRGYINPGYILQRIEDEFLNARLEGTRIDRVMIDNVAHWELCCPFAKEDETFGDTLVELLRRQGVTSLLVCGEPRQEAGSVLQQSIIDNSDCLIRFDRTEFRGSQHVVMRVLKTRGMRHKRELFELVLGPDAMAVQTVSPLLRVVPGGYPTPVRIRLFLHAESNMQRMYNLRLGRAVRSVLSGAVDIESESPIFFGRALQLGAASAVDELQVLQLDEFQVPDVRHGGREQTSLYCFPPTQWKKEWYRFAPRLVERIRAHGYFAAVPYYENLSLMAYRRDRLWEADLSSWESMERKCIAWQEDHNTRDTLFFDFAADTPENYNSLFFEILLSLSAMPTADGECRLKNWLRGPGAVKAARIYRNLCQLAHLRRTSGLPQAREFQEEWQPITVDTSAVVWRHWYSTLAQMMAPLSPEVRNQIAVCPLPGKVAIAGEWYLGIPAYSAAVGVGLDLIVLLTSSEAELERFQVGVGLPTRLSFYESGPEGKTSRTSLSPYLPLDLGVLRNLLDSAFRRSSFRCYPAFSGLLCSHLYSIIGVSGDDQDAVEAQIRNILASLIASIELVRTDECCRLCQASRRADS